MSFPSRVLLSGAPIDEMLGAFFKVWRELMDQECHRASLWDSRFVTALRDPATSAADRYELAAVWSVNMVAGSYCFPRYVAALAARAESDYVRHGLLENAWDEAGGIHHRSRSHFWLAVRLAELLGLSDQEIASIQPLPEATAYTEAHFEECAQGDFEEALGMICLIEEFTTPEFTLIFESFLQSCQEAARISPGQFVLNGGAEYFTANITDDERHRQEMPRLVATLLRDRGVDLSAADLREAMSPIIDGIRRSIALRASFFDGIFAYVEGGGTLRGLLREP